MGWDGRRSSAIALPLRTISISSPESTRIDEKLPDEARADQLTQLAADCGVITPLTVNAIEGVTVMHNLAVHGPHRDITTKQVDEYIVLIQGVIYAIQQNIRRYQAKHLADRT